MPAPTGCRAARAPPRAAIVAVALLIGAAALLPFGLRGAAAAVLALAVTAGLARTARAKIGGQTGDVLGASQQLAEIAVLAALVAR